MKLTNNPRLKTVLYSGLLLLITACNSDDQSVVTADANKVQKQSLAPESKQTVELQSAPVPAVATADTSTTARTTRAMPTETLPRPRMSDFTNGGKVKKKIKTGFYADDSYIVAYETKDEAPTLEIMLLTPNAQRNNYQRINITSLPYEGGIANIEDLFFHDVDNDGTDEMLMIASWRIEHEALGIDATNYRVYVFDNQLSDDDQSLRELTSLMERFGSGTEGELETGPSTYIYKNRQAILDEL